MNKLAMSIGAFALLGFSSNAVAQDFCNATHSGEPKVVSFNIDPGSDKGDLNKIGDYHYEIWSKSGDVSATFYPDGSFSCKFANADDYLCRSGLFYGKNSGKSYKDLGHLYADFSIVDPYFRDYNGVSYSYIGVYGWSQNPLIEWYIVDTWDPYRPKWIGNTNGVPSCDGCGLQGTITVDGAEYDVYVDKVSRRNIEGNGPFVQYFSLRKTKRSCGTIDITAHFEEWEKLGLKLGSSMYEAKVLGEAGQYPENHGANGSIDFNYAKVYASDNGPLPPSSFDSSSSGSGPSDSGEPGDETAIRPLAPMNLAANAELQVFDMQGRFLGRVSAKAGSSLNAVLREKFRDAGVYLVRQGSLMQKVLVK